MAIYSTKRLVDRQVHTLPSHLTRAIAHRIIGMPSFFVGECLGLSSRENLILNSLMCAHSYVSKETVFSVLATWLHLSCETSC